MYDNYKLTSIWHLQGYVLEFYNLSRLFNFVLSILFLKTYFNVLGGLDSIWASVKLGDSLAMLILRETINEIVCCFGGNTDK